MKAVALLFGMLTLVGCAADYQAREQTDRFSDPSQPAVYSMEGNAIDYRAPLGMLPSSQLNAYVTRDRATKKAVSVGFFFSRVASREELVFSGTPKWIGIRPDDEAVFIADGKRVVFRAFGEGKTSAKLSTGIGNSTSTDYYESAQFAGTADDLRTVAEASKIEFQVNGMNGAVSYPRKGKQLLDSFRPNLLQFYRTEVAPYRN